jgi:small subunit ribosomal protein S1
VKVKILEIDDDRRRLSLSLKRVEGQVLPSREIAPAEDGAAPDDGGDIGEVPDLDLSEEVFAGDDVAAEEAVAPAEEAAAPSEEAAAPAEQEAAPAEPEQPGPDPESSA